MPYEIASPRYAEGFWCNIPVDTLACSEQLTVVCWFLPSEFHDCSTGSCDGSDRWYCSHAGKSTRRCNYGTCQWNRQISGLDMQKMISSTWSCLEKTVAKGRNNFSLWFVLVCLENMCSMAMIAYTYMTQHWFNVTSPSTLHYLGKMKDVVEIFWWIDWLAQSTAWTNCMLVSSIRVPWLFRRKLWRRWPVVL